MWNEGWPQPVDEEKGKDGVVDVNGGHDGEEQVWAVVVKGMVESSRRNRAVVATERVVE